MTTRQPGSLRIVVTGASGRLGSAMVDELRAAGHAVTAITRAELDITRPADASMLMHTLQPQAIVNCAAYNAVDAAESNAEAAFAVNARGPAALADAAAAANAVLVHFGSDFVFDGEASTPYVEEAPTNPLSVYGASKLAGERGVRQLRRHYILRVESLFGGIAPAGQRATVDYIADSLSAGNPVRAMVDRTVTPSHVPDVVRATRMLLDRGAPYGTYHCVASGAATWYELANAVARYYGISGLVQPVRADSIAAAAPRPKYCALSNHKLLALGIAMPRWEIAVARHLTARARGSSQLPASSFQLPGAGAVAMRNLG
jgi:dTDP-4-dehydrorhamnose reductase